MAGVLLAVSDDVASVAVVRTGFCPGWGGEYGKMVPCQGGDPRPTRSRFTAVRWSSGSAPEKATRRGVRCPRFFGQGIQ